MKIYPDYLIVCVQQKSRTVRISFMEPVIGGMTADKPRHDDDVNMVTNNVANAKETYVIDARFN